PSTTRWRSKYCDFSSTNNGKIYKQCIFAVVLVAVSICVATGASQWILDPETRVVSLSHSLSNHPFFILSTIILITILLLGVHKRVIAASIITSRTREVLGDFNMSCDDTGKLILRPRPTNIT
ncbi:unnamed protein product, partial [Callosobruchus maculatus]